MKDKGLEEVVMKKGAVKDAQVPEGFKTFSASSGYIKSLYPFYQKLEGKDLHLGFVVKPNLM